MTLKGEHVNLIFKALLRVSKLSDLEEVSSNDKAFLNDIGIYDNDFPIGLSLSS